MSEPHPIFAQIDKFMSHDYPLVALPDGYPFNVDDPDEMSLEEKMERISEHDWDSDAKQASLERSY